MGAERFGRLNEQRTFWCSCRVIVDRHICLEGVRQTKNRSSNFVTNSEVLAILRSSNEVRLTKSARFIAFLSVDTRRVESSRARKMSSHMLPTRAVSAIRAAVVTRSTYVKIPTAMEGYEYAALMRAIEVVKTKPLLRGCSLSKATSCASHLCPFCSSSHEVPTDERSIAHSRCP